MRTSAVYASSIIVFTCGCTSTFETRPYNVATDKLGIKNGISYYETRMVIVRYVFTDLVDSKTGELKGSITDQVNPCLKTVQKDDIQFFPDLSHRMVIVQHPSMFSQSQLQVGFNPNGTLSSINVQATPLTDKILSTLETAAKDKVLALGLKPACNASPIIESIRSAPTFGDTAP